MPCITSCCATNCNITQNYATGNLDFPDRFSAYANMGWTGSLVFRSSSLGTFVLRCTAASVGLQQEIAFPEVFHGKIDPTAYTV